MMTTKIKAPADILADAGRALYGEHWRLALARALDIDDDTIRRWMRGKTALREDHPAFDDLERLLDRRREELRHAAEVVAAWRAAIAARAEAAEAKRTADKIDGFDRDDLGESPDY